MKFHKEKKIILEQPEMIYTQVVDPETAPFPPFQVIANRLGVKVSGQSTVFESMEDLQAFAKIISDAWQSHSSMKPKIVTGV